MKKIFYFIYTFFRKFAENLGVKSSKKDKIGSIVNGFIFKKQSPFSKFEKGYIVLSLVFGFSITQSFGQRDQITTQAGENIRCRILDETPSQFLYAYLSSGGKVLRSEIFKNLVADFKYNFYPNDVITKGNKLPNGLGKLENAPAAQRMDIRKSEFKEKDSGRRVLKKKENPVYPLAVSKPESEFKNYLQWRLGGKGGLGNMLAKISSADASYNSYQAKLSRGVVWGVDAAYFPVDNIGFGWVFNNFRTSNRTENIPFFNQVLNKLDTGYVANERSVKYVGPAVYLRKNIDFKTMIILGLSPGIYFYKDKVTYNNTNHTFKGMDFGAAATLGIDFLLGNDITGRDIILSFEAGYNYGKMRALDFGAESGGAVNLAMPIDLSRLDFTIGLRFTRFPKYLTK